MTGTGIDHEHNALVEQAARHLSEHRVYPVPVVPYLRKMFPLTPAEACEAIRLANLYKARRAAA